MSRKPVLIAQLADEELGKEILVDAFRQFAAHYAKSKFALNSDSDSDADSSDGELCACKCQRVAHKASVREMGDDSRPLKCSDKSEKKRDKNANSDGHYLNNNNNSIAMNGDRSRDDEKPADELCGDRYNGNEDNGDKVVAGEEKKKKRSEKKKAQKKKRREKEKAEKRAKNDRLKTEFGDDCENIMNKNNSISSSDGKNDGRGGKKKNSNDSTKQNGVQQKSDGKSETEKLKRQYNNGNDLSDRQSVKSSPKSDRDTDGPFGADVEEEELSFSSAYVSQIAQRKSKPTKSAQTQSDAQDYSHNYDVDHHKNVNNIAINMASNNYNINYGNKPMKESFAGDEPFGKPKPTAEQRQKLNKSKENNAPNIGKSIELAILANEKAVALKFNEAIGLFTKALQYNPSDYRLFVNRSYCYDSVQDYRAALRDAEIAIQIRPDWPKCHYRKGKALAGLKNYQEAEIALKRVLNLENGCDEALAELWNVRYGAIIDMGYDSSTANIYSSQHDWIKDALEALSLRSDKSLKLESNNQYNRNTVQRAQNVNLNPWNLSLPSVFMGRDVVSQSYGSTALSSAKIEDIWEDDDIYVSDDEYNSESYAQSYPEDMSPTNPFGWKALWVGNVALNAKLDTVTAMFQKFGNLSYCNIFKGNNGGNFILVHYDNPDSPRLAMTKYQGKIIPGISISDSPLTIRFRPNKDQKKPNYDQRLESDECYYWRTTGCARGDSCLYKHIGANRGVDKQAWMCNPLKKVLPYNSNSNNNNAKVTK